jgi:hypothetical protein
MRARGQFVSTLILVALVAGAGFYLQRQVGPKEASAAVPGSATSGAWFCPHGGGPADSKDWHATLAIANPGKSDVAIRVTDLGSEKPQPAQPSTVPAGQEVLLSVPADAPESATFVEYFGGWVSAGWVMRAQGDISGVAAESCAPQADRSWTLADGSTNLPQGLKQSEHDEDTLVVMNPFAVDAALTVVLLTQDRRPIHTKELTDFVLPAERSIAIPVSTDALGYGAVSAVVQVSVGRVAAASLGTSFTDGIRSTAGVPGSPPNRVFLPAGPDRATSQLIVAAPRTSTVRLSGSVYGKDAVQPVSGLAQQDQQDQQGGTSRSYDATIEGPSAFELGAGGPNGIAAAVRTVAANTSHDEAATAGAPTAAENWVVPPAAVSEPATASLLLLNPGTQDARVTLRALVPTDAKGAPDSTTVTVPAGRTVSAPNGFVAAAPTASISAASPGEPIVAASAAFSEGRHGVGGFAISTGVVDPGDP